MLEVLAPPIKVFVLECVEEQCKTLTIINLVPWFDQNQLLKSGCQICSDVAL